MSRIIINNESSAHDTFALQCVKQIISEGRVSDNGESYCYVTIVHAVNIVVAAKRNKDSDGSKTSDTFTVMDYQNV